MAEILIVEDERVIRESLKAKLSAEGYEIRTARNGREALEKIALKRPDLVLLDVMMPEMNGFRCCEEIRRAHALLPVVFLTAKDSDADQVRALGLGGDDFVSKTANETVLLARIARGVARAADIQDDALPAERIRLGSVTVDFDRMEVVDGKGGTERLTATEANILRLLASRLGASLSGDALIDALRGTGFACEDGMLYAHVSRLRRKLGAASALLVCDRGQGYRLKV